MDSHLGLLFCSTGLHVCFVPVPSCFYCCGSVVSLEVGHCENSSIALFAQYCLGYLQTLCFQMNFRDDFSISVMSVIGNSIGI
jgi:hypothetical protein